MKVSYPIRYLAGQPLGTSTAAYGASLAQARYAVGLYTDTSQDFILSELIATGQELIASAMGSAYPLTSKTYYFDSDGPCVVPNGMLGITAPLLYLNGSRHPFAEYSSVGVDLHFTIPDGSLDVNTGTNAMRVLILGDNGGTGPGSRSVGTALKAIISGLYHGQNPSEYMSTALMVLGRYNRANIAWH